METSNSSFAFTRRRDINRVKRVVHQADFFMVSIIAPSLASDLPRNSFLSALSVLLSCNEDCSQCRTRGEYFNSYQD